MLKHVIADHQIVACVRAVNGLQIERVVALEHRDLVGIEPRRIDGDIRA
jgi:hypothetical protein